MSNSHVCMVITFERLLLLVLSILWLARCLALDVLAAESNVGRIWQSSSMLIQIVQLPRREISHLKAANFTLASIGILTNLNQTCVQQEWLSGSEAFERNHLATDIIST